MLNGQGVQLQQLTEVNNTNSSSSEGGISLSLGGSKKIKSRDITVLTRQMATLLEAGFPLSRALEFVSRQDSSGSMSEMVGDLSRAIQQGRDFSQALEDYPQYFGGIYLSMIRAGETGGILAIMLNRLAEMREADEALNDRFKSAMTYPALMLGAMVIALGVMFAYVVPQFSTMFEDMGRFLGPFCYRNNIAGLAQRGELRIVGTSGTVTTLTGVFLDLPRYDRSQVDGAYLGFSSIQQISDKLRRMHCTERANHPCIGEDRADLVVAGCAILEAMCRRWPVGQLRVADRGLREGILFELMAAADRENLGRAEA